MVGVQAQVQVSRVRCCPTQSALPSRPKPWRGFDPGLFVCSVVPQTSDGRHPNDRLSTGQGDGLRHPTNGPLQAAHKVYAAVPGRRAANARRISGGQLLRWDLMSRGACGTCSSVTKLPVDHEQVASPSALPGPGALGVGGHCGAGCHGLCSTLFLWRSAGRSGPKGTACPGKTCCTRASTPNSTGADSTSRGSRMGCGRICTSGRRLGEPLFGSDGRDRAAPRGSCVPGDAGPDKASGADGGGRGMSSFLHRYNYHRPHTALRGFPPVHRTPVVTNLSGYNT